MQRESSKLNLLKKYSEELGPGFEVKDGTMFCKFCKATLLVQKKSQIMQHVRTKKHQHHIQDFQQHMPLGTCTQEEFEQDLINALISSDIPFHKLLNPILREFLKKWTNMDIPQPSTLWRRITPAYETIMKNMIEKYKNQCLWLS